MDEIPEALRDTPIEPLSSAPSPLSRLLATLTITFGLSAVGLAATIAWMWFTPTSANRDIRDQPPQSSALSASEDDTASRQASRFNATEATPAASDETSPTEAVDLLGHLPYSEAPLDELVPITDDGVWELRAAAADRFLAMQAAAKADGVDLAVLSAFRTIADQQTLFFEVKAERGQVATERAEVSAPPGYSEHHTGYAIDIGDGNAPETDLSVDFEETEAFAWLEENAAYFSFELSFPFNNEQGIAYEPWHWRFVGDQDSLETFYRARSKGDRRNANQ
ncbi:MAG: D-alanyl-D-alanine carboxypeptidase family protein [Oscillatoriales cyanobacterium]|nr:MAG: D-alanyl-D-alanine carboxypeptidase family protein [Oscillatoriales cyanobacterium]